MIINTLMTESYYIAKVFKQHNSLVIVVPSVVCIVLEIKAGSHVVFTWNQSEGTFKFSKFNPEGSQDGASEGSPDRKDTGG